MHYYRNALFLFQNWGEEDVYNLVRLLTVVIYLPLFSFFFFFNIISLLILSDMLLSVFSGCYSTC